LSRFRRALLQQHQFCFVCVTHTGVLQQTSDLKAAMALPDKGVVVLALMFAPVADCGISLFSLILSHIFHVCFTKPAHAVQCKSVVPDSLHHHLSGQQFWF
jgi:Na+-translocating ferredoxin:NAD+ oxidoreductase RnfD subunit